MHNRNSNTPRKLAVLSALALAVMLMPTALAQKTNNFNIAATQSRLNFELHNETGYEITEVYVSPNTTEDWQEDILGQDTLQVPHRNGRAVQGIKCLRGHRLTHKANAHGCQGPLSTVQ